MLTTSKPLDSQLTPENWEAPLLTWELIRNRIETDSVHLLRRSLNAERKYRDWIVKIKEEYGSTDVYVQQVALGWQDSEGRTVKGPDYKFVPNDFPYNMEEGLSHWVFWYRKDYSLEDIKRILQHELPGKEFQFFINPKARQSVKTVSHAHVMFREKTAEE
ncbi:hypothetical protein K493DRAFT_318091 [Basidiobolus meristosporus CBS 931.73]|uniref:Uncharacterized protein n=1 Tax=Basidiobolus meristosporus CBS 931.73 TaxID=1314790 RepID=A0A1Y1XY56_9FUNG|nr:hypothetical protein K493DRAFT_318091 [Basidiobolus meristosporus CBS 931.73]|eukprot:ORX90294.1 hypothetical protein K493DRAFT_318091 [Basidiobolus meristosporus CBS 931.73]